MIRRKTILSPTPVHVPGFTNRAPSRMTVTTQKPPKLRFKPGEFYEYEGKRHMVVCAFRIASNPHEWLFYLEDASKALDGIGVLANSLGLGNTTPRITYDIFRDGMDAMRFFNDIPLNGDWSCVPNKTMLKLKKL